MSGKRAGNSYENATGDARLSGDRKFVVALARGLDVLRSFRPDDDMLGNLEIAERTGIPKPTVSRLTYTLTQLGYLAHVPRFSKYKIAPAALALGYSALAQLGIRQIARPYMQAIADQAGASVALGAPDKRRMIYVEHCFNATALMVRLDIGSRIPLAASAMGRAYIAVLPAEKREELFEDLARYYGDRWPGLRRNIDGACEEVARRGFSPFHGRLAAGHQRHRGAVGHAGRFRHLCLQLRRRGLLLVQGSARTGYRTAAARRRPTNKNRPEWRYERMADR